MKLPEYVTRDEVSRICRALKIRDWSRLGKAAPTKVEAKKILAAVNTEKMPIGVEQFLMGLNIELEHGRRFKDANVTNNHPMLTGMIVLAHLRESLYYYKLLDVAESEGNLAKAVAAGNAAKIKTCYKNLAEARIVLAKAEMAAVK